MIKTVLIMLSTYNGQKYIREQLDSLYNQKDVDIHILVRDDGSKDNTVEILKEYQQRLGRMTILSEPNVGAARSFYKLLIYAKLHFNKFDYYAFSDQDDVWKTDKLSYSINKLANSTSLLKLFYGNVCVTNAGLAPIRQRERIKFDTLQNNIIGNKQLGCTQVFNYNLFEKIVVGINAIELNNVQYYPLHDVWTSLVAFAFNADIIYGEDPKMYYRQHELNVVGAGSSRLLTMYYNRVKRLVHNPNTKSTKCRYMLQVYNDIPPESKNTLALCAIYKETGLNGRLRLAFNKSFHTQTFLQNIGFVISVLSGKF